MKTPPVVMTFSGHDPSGGAGIQADIETLSSQHCHAVPVVTTLTVQDTRNVTKWHVVDPDLVRAQAEAILADMPVAAFKTGLLGCAETVATVAALAEAHPGIPLVVDPVLASGAGDPLAGAGLPEAIITRLLPNCRIVTPNSLEARRLSGCDGDLDDCARALLAAGAGHVLITGTHEAGEHVVNRLYRQTGAAQTFTWERLPHSYHGSGCTLAAGIAGLLAHGMDLFTACHEAQDYTWQALQAGFRPGSGQHLPDRLFWAHPGNET